MSDAQDTFSIELIGFSGAAGPEQVVRGLVEVFGLDEARARACVENIPIRVKANAAPTDARRMASALLAIGADVRIASELSGASKEYYAGAAGPAGQPSDPPPDSTRLVGMGDPRAPVSAPPPPISVRPQPGPTADSPYAAIAAPGAMAAPPAAPAPTSDPSPSSRRSLTSGPGGGATAGSPYGAFGSDASELGGLRSTGSKPLAVGAGADALRTTAPSPGSLGAAAFDALRSTSGSVPLPPVGTAIGEDGQHLANPCPSCRRLIPRAKRCPRCGWNKAAGRRECIKCGAPLALTYAPVFGSIVTIIALVFLAAAGGATFWFVGLLATLGFPIAMFATMVAARGATVSWSCTGCEALVEASALKPDEASHAVSMRRNHLIGAAALGVLAILPALAYVPRPTIEHQSTNGVFRIGLPRMHRDIVSSSADVSTDYGLAVGTMYEAVNRQMQIKLFRFIEAEIATMVPNSSDRMLESSLAVAVEMLAGQPGKIEQRGEINGSKGIETTFSGSFEGQPIHGRARAYLVDKSLVILLFAGSSPSAIDHPDGLAFLEARPQ